MIINEWNDWKRMFEKEEKEKEKYSKERKLYTDEIINMIVIMYKKWILLFIKIISNKKK